MSRHRIAFGMRLLAELQEFVHDHRPHGPPTADATEPAWNGYLLTVACPCGVVFERWVSRKKRTASLLLGPPSKPATESGDI